jgi:uncharacterized protein (TIGR00296 family)
VSFQLTQKEGEALVRLARNAVEEYLKTGKTLTVPKDVSPKFMENCGVFVTLNNVEHGRKELRGCIGFPYPTHPLAQAVIESAIESATQDPRFPSVTLQELGSIVFEISVLTPPELIEVKKPTDYPLKIKAGRDGLIVEKGYCKGLLLPQVPVEWNWNEEEFLCQCCIKAGLQPDNWLLKETKIYRFQAIIFEELEPKGKIVQKKL